MAMGGHAAESKMQGNSGTKPWKKMGIHPTYGAFEVKHWVRCEGSPGLRPQARLANERRFDISDWRA